MNINVTSENIRNGKRSRARICPVALAMLDAGLEDAAAPLDTIKTFASGRIVCQQRLSFFSWRVGERCFVAPDHVATFIRAFDRGDAVRPFSFTLPV